MANRCLCTIAQLFLVKSELVADLIILRIPRQMLLTLVFLKLILFSNGMLECIHHSENSQRASAFKQGCSKWKRRSTARMNIGKLGFLINCLIRRTSKQCHGVESELDGKIRWRNTANSAKMEHDLKKKRENTRRCSCSVAQSCLTLCDPMYCSMPDLPVHHQLPEFTQTHIH